MLVLGLRLRRKAPFSSLLPLRPEGVHSATVAGRARTRQTRRQQGRVDRSTRFCGCVLGSLVCLPKRNQFPANYRFESSDRFFVSREFVVILAFETDQIRQIGNESKEIDVPDLVC